MGFNEEKHRRMVLRNATRSRVIEPPESPHTHGGPEYLVSFTCFKCRKSFEKPAPDEKHRSKCTDCQGELYEMGRNFKSPKTDNTRQWEKVQILYAHGFRFIGSGNHEGADLPKKLREVDEFIKEHPDHPLRVASTNKTMLAKLSATGTR